MKHSNKQIVPLNEMHILAIDIFDLPLMVLEIIEVKCSRGVCLLHVFSYISHYNSRSRHARVKHSINRLFLSMRRTF